MGIRKNSRRILDDEDLFRHYYVRMGAGGSLNKLLRYARQKYGDNPETRRPLTNSGIWYSMNRYLVDNYDNPEIKNIFVKYDIDCGLNPPSDEKYLEIISEKARTLYTRAKYKKFCDEHPDIPFMGEKPYKE